MKRTDVCGARHRNKSAKSTSEWRNETASFERKPRNGIAGFDDRMREIREEMAGHDRVTDKRIQELVSAIADFDPRDVKRETLR
jgi:hypothetical protein